MALDFATVRSAWSKRYRQYDWARHVFSISRRCQYGLSNETHVGRRVINPFKITDEVNHVDGRRRPAKPAVKGHDVSQFDGSEDSGPAEGDGRNDLAEAARSGWRQSEGGENELPGSSSRWSDSPGPGWGELEISTDQESRNAGGLPAAQQWREGGADTSRGTQSDSGRRNQFAGKWKAKNEKGQVVMRTKSFGVHMGFIARVNAAGDKRDWQGAREVLNEALAHAFKRDIANTYLFGAVLKVAMKCGRPRAAVNTIALMKKEGVAPNRACYNMAISACKKGDSSRAVMLLKDMQDDGIEPDVISYNTTMAACGNGGQWEEALKLLEEIRTKGLSPDCTSFSTAITACGKSGKWERAVALLKQMRQEGVIPDNWAYFGVIAACEVVGKWAEAVAVFEEMRKEHAGVPSRWVFNVTIAAYGGNRQWKKALETFEEMEEVGVTPDVVSYAAIITALGKDAQWERALGVFRRLPETDVRPDAACYNAVITTCSRWNELEHAAAVLQQMEDDSVVSPSVVSYNPILIGYWKLDRWEQLLTRMDEMRQKGIAPDHVSYNAAINACAKAGQWQQALRLVKDMHRDCVNPGTQNFADAFTACSENGQLEHAVALSKEMQSAGIIRRRTF